MCFYGRKRVLPVLTDVSQLLPSFAIVRTVIAGLAKLFGRPFQVTPKGSLSGDVLIQWSYILPFALGALGTFLGILINTSAYAELNDTPGFGVNVFWSIYSLASTSKPDHDLEIAASRNGLRAYASVPEKRASIGRYIDGFYNTRRPHSSLDRRTPDEAYFTALLPTPVGA